LNPITVTSFLSIKIGDHNNIFLKAALSAWADGLAVCKADAKKACDAVAGNAVGCGGDSSDDHIPRTSHS
jgi:hypothetical protein